MNAVSQLKPQNTTWEARECMVFLGNDGGISLRNVINGEKYAKLIANTPTLVEHLRACIAILGEQCVRIDAEWGLRRNLDNLTRDGDLPKELIEASALLRELGEL